MFDFRFSKVVGIVRKNSNYLVVPYSLAFLRASNWGLHHVEKHHLLTRWPGMGEIWPIGLLFFLLQLQHSADCGTAATQWGFWIHPERSEKYVCSCASVVKYMDITVHSVTLSHCCRNSHAIWDHTVLPASWQRWHSCLYPSRSRYSI